MKLTEALQNLQRAPKSAPPFRVLLACGFTPLHLKTFLAAHLQSHLPERYVEVGTGLYGDLPGTLENCAKDAPHAIVVAIEWADLDPRLGFREGGSWTDPAGIVDAATGMMARLASALERAPAGVPLAVSLPTLPLPPFFHTASWQSSRAELRLEEIAAAFASRLAARDQIRLLNVSWLAERSPAPCRFDLKLDLSTGFPYTLSHADALAEGFADLLHPPPRKKGIITDLDNTLWNGIVGEIGPDAVSWDTNDRVHALYQKLLASFAGNGTLVGVASKNDPQIVERTLARPDLLLSPDRIFPLEVHWNAKSGSVEKILRTWNIAADSVVFVDDSPMELAEVGAAHPGIECVRFPAGDPAAAYVMFRRLRDLFGTGHLSPEDALRLESIRQGARFQDLAEAGAVPEDFLAQAGAKVHFSFTEDGPRAFELVNKTNQFNLNGRRYSEADWRSELDSGAFLMIASYQDKFGALGKIAVLLGRESRETVRVRTWVMSCRAFARRIEHQCIKTLFERTGAQEIEFDFIPTPKNKPAEEFLTALLGSKPQGTCRLSRRRFDECRPALYHEVVCAP